MCVGFQSPHIKSKAPRPGHEGRIAVQKGVALGEEGEKAAALENQQLEEQCDELKLEVESVKVAKEKIKMKRVATPMKL